MAWKHAWKTEEEYKCFQKKIKEHFKDGCPICHCHSIEMFDCLTYRRIGKIRFQFFSVVCRDCGHLMDFEVKRFMKNNV